MILTLPWAIVIAMALYACAWIVTTKMMAGADEGGQGADAVGFEHPKPREEEIDP